MMLVKIRMDMPLPTPRCVISSPSHMTIAVPAVNVRITSAMLAGVNRVPGKTSIPLCDWLWNRKTSPVDCSSARTTVR